MKYLITGGAGFIGSHLAESIADSGEKVTIIDDLSTGAIENIEHLKGRDGFRYVLDTVMNRSLMAELVDDADVILHLAAAVGVRLIVESPVRTIETNIKGTEIVLELAAKKRKRVMIFSTSEVYGKSNRDTFVETGDLVIVGLAKHPDAIGEIFNVGGKEEVSIEELAGFVKEVLESPSPIVYIPYEEAYEEGFEDMRRRVPDISRTRSLLQYAPRYGLRDIVLDVAQYQRDRSR